MACASGIVHRICMAQGATQGSWSGAKPAVTKAPLPSKGGPTAGTQAPAQSAAKSGAKPVAQGAPAAPKMQPRAVAAPVAKPVAAAPQAPSARKPPPLPLDADADGVTKVEAMPAAAPPRAIAPSQPNAAPRAPESAPQPAAPPAPQSREEIGRIVRSMVEQATAPMDRAMRAMVEEATAPMDRTMRALVEQATAPLERTIRDLQRRLDEVERRPVPAPVVVAPTIAPAAPLRAPALAQPGHSAARGLDIAAIERSVMLGPEMRAFDGRRRRLRLVLAVVFACLVVFAGLFAALAESYTHAHP
jgi:hypothetical protein